MSWFRRKGEQIPADAESTVESGTDPSTADQESVAATAPVDETVPQRGVNHGPFDLSELAERPTDRLDLGSLLVPGQPGMELRLEVDQETQQLVGLTLAYEGSQLQLQAFAAPRTLGIWDDIRDEIQASIEASQGEAEVVDGPFGTELFAHLQQMDHLGRRSVQPIRFIGVDGPRWFLRGVLSGAGANEIAKATALYGVMSQTVVVRGDAAMAPREVLPLTPPPEMMQAVQGEDAEPGEGQPDGGAEPGHAVAAGVEADDAAGEPNQRRMDDLNPFERGPEITEVR